MEYGIIGILILPVVGLLLWFFVGPRGNARAI